MKFVQSCLIRGSFPFPVVCVPYLDSNIPSKIFYSFHLEEKYYNQQEQPMMSPSFK